MKTYFKLLVSLGVLIIFNAACQTTNVSTPVPSATSSFLQKWWNMWLVNSSCQPPCWQNITPGVTTIDEAISILEKLPEIKITSKSEFGVSWDFIQNKDEGGTVGISEDGIVRTIWLSSVSERKLLLKTIVASYNEPEYVKPYDCREGMCVTALVYPDEGLILSVFVENTGYNSSQEEDPNPEIEILPDTVVNRVYFIEPGLESFRNLLRLQAADPIMDWKGYGKYP
jgi:hypothetical protein